MLFRFGSLYCWSKIPKVQCWSYNIRNGHQGTTRVALLLCALFLYYSILIWFCTIVYTGQFFTRQSGFQHFALSHRRLECLLNSLFWPVPNEISKLRIVGALWGESTDLSSFYLKNKCESRLPSLFNIKTKPNFVFGTAKAFWSFMTHSSQQTKTRQTISHQ